MREYQELYRAPLPKIRFDGLDTSSSELFIKDDKSPAMQNIDLRPVGGIRKRDGFSFLGNVAGTTGTVHQFLPVSSTKGERLYLVRGTNIFMVDALSPTVPWYELVDETFAVGGAGRSEQAFFVNEGADPGSAASWVYYDSVGYIVTGEDEPILALGSSTVGSQLTTWPEGSYLSGSEKRGYPARWNDADGLGTPDWPKGLFYAGDPTLSTSEVHETSFCRMFAYGFDSDPDRIDYSQLGVPYNMIHADPVMVSPGFVPGSEPPEELPPIPVDVPLEDGGFFYAMRGDGDRVVGVRQLADMTVVFKRKRIFLYQGTLGDDFKQVGILPVGAVSDGSIVIAGNDIYFWSNDGPRSLSGVIKYGSINQFSISASIFETVREVSVDSKKHITARFEREYNRILWGVGREETAYTDSHLVYYLPSADAEEGRWSLWNGLYSQIPVVAQLNPAQSANTLVFGVDSDGALCEMNSGPTDGGSPISSFYETRWLDLSVLSINKRLMSLLVIYGTDGVGHSTIEYGVNYSSDMIPTGHRLYEHGTTTPGLGLWDNEDWDDFVWSSSGRSMIKHGLSNLGFIVKFRITESSTLGFSIAGMALDVDFKGKV